MSDLREALEKLIEAQGPNGYVMTYTLKAALANHPVEVAPETGFARPLIDREAVARALFAYHQRNDAYPCEWENADQYIQGDWLRNADAVVKLARPMPTRDQIDQALAGKPIVRSADKPSDWRGGLSPNEIDDVATIVLALLNGDTDA